MNTLALGIDLGLTGARAVAVDQEGHLAGRGRSNHGGVRRGPGRAELDPAACMAAVVDAAHRALEGVPARDVAGVGVAALGSAPLLVDEDLRPLTPALLFSLDRRGEDERRRLVEELDLSEEDLTHDSALPKLLWWQEHAPELWARAALALDATGYIVSVLTGVPTMDAITARDYGVAGYTAPIPIPDPGDPLGLAGGLTADMAGRLGLRAGIPVTIGTYDSYVDIAGIGVRQPGDSGILLGSTVIVGHAVAEPLRHPGLQVSTYLGRGFLLGGWTLSGGSILDWLVETLGRGPDGDELIRMACGLEPGAGGLLALPYFEGERTPIWDPHARGVVVGLTTTTDRPQLYRAFVDAVALSVRDHVERLREAGFDIDRWRVGGGGVHNPAWLQAVCDAVGAPLDVVSYAGEAVAPALLVLRAMGTDLDLAIDAQIAPAPSRAARFNELYGLYRGLYPSLANVMHALSRLDASAEYW